jgi:uncharacterized delta-60 repeat protein
MFALAIAGCIAAAAHLRAETTLDTSFRPPGFAYPDLSSRVLLLPNGKYVTYFNVETLVDQTTGAITQYLADGTLDTSFNFSPDYGSVTAVAALPDSTLVVAAQRFPYGAGFNDHLNQSQRILHLNSDGSIDPGFDTNGQAQTSGGEVRAIITQPDNKILVAGRFTSCNGQPRQGIVRLNANGSLDNGFATITLTGAHSFDGTHTGLWGPPALQLAGNAVAAIYIGGDFEGVSDGTNSISCPAIARLGANGTVDTTFQPSGFQNTFSTGGTRLRPVRGIVIQSDARIVIGGRFSVAANFLPANTTGAQYNLLPLIRLNTNGTADQSYGYFGSMNTADSSFIQIRALVIQPDDKVIGVDTSVWRFNTDGNLDSGFRQPDLLIGRMSANNLPLTVKSIPDAFTTNLRSDGRVLVAGTFDDVDDAPPLPANGQRSSVAQFNSDGTLDTSFTTSHVLAENAYPTSFLRLPDGHTLIAFNATGSSTGTPAIPHNFGRLTADGSLDTTFDPLGSLSDGAANAVGFVQLPDGNILGFGTRVADGTSAYGPLRPDGTNGGNNYKGDPTVFFTTATAQADGKVLIGANSVQDVVNGNQLRRLNTDGSLDTSFHLSASIVSDEVKRNVNNVPITIATESKVIAVQSGGGILFAYLAADGTYRLVRLNTDGSLDGSFQAGSVSAIAVSSISASTIHDPQTNANVFVTQLSSSGVPALSDGQLVGNGQLVVAGQFTSYAATTAHGLVRLNNSGAVDSTFNTGAGAQWTQTTETATFHPAVDNIEQASNGKLLITGSFEAFNGVASPGIAVLNTDGSVDSSFVAPAIRQKYDYHATYLQKQSDGSFLLSGPYAAADQSASPSVLHVFGAPAITSPTTASIVSGQQFVYQLIATGATITSATGLPAGLSYNASLRVIAGTPNVTGTFQVTLSASNVFGSASASLTLTIQPPPPGGPVITSSTSATGRTGSAFKFQVATSGGSAAARVAATGLPPGLVIDSVTGLISGTPTADGSSAVALLVTDGNFTASGTLQLSFTSDPTVPVIISPSTASLTSGQQFTYTIVAPTGGFDGSYTGGYNGTSNFDGGGSAPVSGPVDFTVTNGVITVTDPGSGSGTVSASGTATFTGSGATDDASYTFNGTFSILSDGSVSAGGNWSSPFAGGTASGAWSATRPPNSTSAGIGSDEPTTYTLIGTLPTGLFFDSKNGVISGTYQGSPLRDGTWTERTLSGGIISNVQLFATNSHGTSTTPLVFFNAPIGSVNISTRLDVGTADNVLIGGFIVTGNAPKKVLIRAVGPSIKAGDSPLAGALQDTTLELYQGPTLLGSNDDWRTEQEQEIKDTGVAPTDDRESAIVATLAPQTGYTAIVRGKAGAVGIGLAEIYDLGTASLDSSSVSHLANISTRGTVLTADNVMIGGFIISGANTKVLARAIGPSLAAQGVSGALQDTILELHDSSGALVASNDDWRSTQQQQIIDTTVPPNDDRESAIVATLQPGAYTAVVRGKSDSTGVALVEIYSLQ